LRERKKIRTRRLLIDVAVQLCLAGGYHSTTVDQIAESADVSPRTFSRYFSTKEAVFLALLDDLVAAVAVELTHIPADVPVLAALRDAHIAALKNADSVGDVGLTSDRVVRMLQVINSTPELKAAAAEQHPESIGCALAAALGVPVDDRRLRLARAVWSAIIVTGCGDLVESRDGHELGPELMIERIRESFDDFIALTAAGRGAVDAVPTPITA